MLLTAAKETGGIAWDKWVAIGTLALAAGTVLLAGIGVATAWFTRRLATETKDLAVATRDAVEAAHAEIAAQLRPLIVDALPAGEEKPDMYPWQEIETAHNVLVSFHNSLENEKRVIAYIRNVGVGPAFISKRQPTLSFKPNGRDPHEGLVTQPVIGVGDTERIQFLIPSESNLPSFYVTIRYTDAGGQQPTRTTLYVHQTRPGDETYGVTGIAIYAGDNPEPTVAIGYGFGRPHPVIP